METQRRLHARAARSAGRFSGRIRYRSEKVQASRSSAPQQTAHAVYVKALADTGALLAYLDATDRWHERCRSAFGQLRLPLTTSTAVLTELFHLVGDSPREMDITWKFVRSGALTLASISDRDLPHLEALMRKYHDRPMDYADATLVHLAQRESLWTVFTIDHDDFATYRVSGRKRLRILPSR